MNFRIGSILVAIVLLMGACGSDDDEDVNLAKEIAAVYNGTLDMSVMGANQGQDEDSKVTIKSQANGQAEITLKGFGVGTMILEDVIVPNVVVAKEDGSYTLTGTIKSTNGTTEITGTLAGTVKDGKADIVFNIKPGAMPMPITATFSSK